MKNVTPSLAAAAMTALWVQAVGADRLFLVGCAPLTIQRGDPIVFPGQISPHVHAVVGGTGFALKQSNADAVASKATTCDKILDNSNYWQPQLYHERKDGKFEIVTFQGMVWEAGTEHETDWLLMCMHRLRTTLSGLVTMPLVARTVTKPPSQLHPHKVSGW